MVISHILPDRLMVGLRFLVHFNNIPCKAAGSSNGRTLVSGTKYLGSSPSPAALHGMATKQSHCFVRFES